MTPHELITQLLYKALVGYASPALTLYVTSDGVFFEKKIDAVRVSIVKRPIFGTSIGYNILTGKSDVPLVQQRRQFYNSIFSKYKISKSRIGFSNLIFVNIAFEYKDKTYHGEIVVEVFSSDEEQIIEILANEVKTPYVIVGQYLSYMFNILEDNNRVIEKLINILFPTIPQSQQLTQIDFSKISSSEELEIKPIESKFEEKKIETEVEVKPIEDKTVETTHEDELESDIEKIVNLILHTCEKYNISKLKLLSIVLEKLSQS